MRIDIRRQHPSAPVLAMLVALGLAVPAALAAPPGEVQNVRFDDAVTLGWDATPGAADYNVYRGALSDLVEGRPPACHGDEITATSFATPPVPAPGSAWVYLLTAENASAEEGTPGSGTGGPERELFGRCDPVMQAHVLDRIGFGWSDWLRDRLQALGYTAFRDEQLDPATIDESTNGALNSRVTTWTPPVNDAELNYLMIDRAIYARRQLEQKMTIFWLNHFNTWYLKTYEYLYPFFFTDGRRHQETAEVHDRENSKFRDLAVNGTLHDIVRTSALGPPMLIYLDTILNIKDRPNENYPRELLELHTMGVDNGYDEQDVRELARVFTGWEVCKKTFADEGDPLAPCIDPYLGGPGAWTGNFNFNQHDCGAKTLFAASPYQTVIPATCDGSGNPTIDGVDDVDLALDGILAHPSTKEFISTKLLQALVTEEPTQAMIDTVTVAYDTHAGSLRELLRAVLAPEHVLDPDLVGQKIKSPFEHVVSTNRAIDAQTGILNIVFTRDWLFRMGELHYWNETPTGYPEIGADWLNTNAMLDRQDFGMIYAFDTFYGGRINQMVNDAGLNTAEQIVDFWADLLFGGALTPFERQQAIDYLNTDDNGNPSPYDDARIRETVGFMMGFRQFVEQ